MDHGCRRRGRHPENGLDRPVPPQMYGSMLQVSSLSIVVLLKAQDDIDVADVLRREVRAVDADLPVYGVRSLDDLLARATASRRFAMLLVGLFGLAALMLSALGIYGVIAYTVSQQRQELGIRLALGAAPAAVLRMVLLEGLRLTTIGVACGLVAAVATARLLSGLLFGVGPTIPSPLPPSRSCLPPWHWRPAGYPPGVPRRSIRSRPFDRNAERVGSVNGRRRTRPSAVNCRELGCHKELVLRLGCRRAAPVDPLTALRLTRERRAGVKTDTAPPIGPCARPADNLRRCSPADDPCFRPERIRNLLHRVSMVRLLAFSYRDRPAALPSGRRDQSSTGSLRPSAIRLRAHRPTPCHHRCPPGRRAVRANRHWWPFADPVPGTRRPGYPVLRTVVRTLPHSDTSPTVPGHRVRSLGRGTRQCGVRAARCERFGAAPRISGAGALALERCVGCRDNAGSVQELV